MKYRIGLDLGGTKLLGVVTDSELKVKHRKKHRLFDRADIFAVMDQIGNVYDDLTNDIKPNEIISACIALPSPVDNQIGEAKQLTAFKQNNFPVRRELRERTKVEFKLGNDVNMATLAEYNFGAGKGASSPNSFRKNSTLSIPFAIEYLLAFSLTIGIKSDSSSWYIVPPIIIRSTPVILMTLAIPIPNARAWYVSNSETTISLLRHASKISAARKLFGSIALLFPELILSSSNVLKPW
jgi:hypothetical protein